MALHLVAISSFLPMGFEMGEITSAGCIGICTYALHGGMLHRVPSLGLFCSKVGIMQTKQLKVHTIQAAYRASWCYPAEVSS
jgi:hypothetical protein